MEYVFGPVPSRRLGRSLGIDPVPFKTCNWNCVYCQLGRTSPLANDRRAYAPVDEILDQAKRALAAHGPEGIDWVTVVGSGEPTLHAELGTLVRGLKELGDIPVAVLTNGSLFYLSDVRAALLAADSVMPTVSAGSKALYLRLLRPARELTFERFVEGLVDFRREYTGWLWVEVMLVKGMNDTPEALRDIAAIVGLVRPDEVHLSLPTRPPCEAWVEPADEAGVDRAVTALGEVARVVAPSGGSFDLSGHRDVVNTIIAIITRHPMSERELMAALKEWDQAEVSAALLALASSGQARAVSRHGERFWTSPEARYVERRRPPGGQPEHGGSRSDTTSSGRGRGGPNEPG